MSDLSADPSAPGDRVDTVLAYLRSLAPTRDLTAKAVMMRLQRAAHWAEIETRRQLTPLGMDVWEMELLTTLLRTGGTTMGRLQDAAQLTSGAITNRIGRLEDRGYVTRVIDQTDRRQIRVRLTESGEERAEAVMIANNEAERRVLEAVDSELLGRLATDLREFLLEAEGEDPGEGPRD